MHVGRGRSVSVRCPCDRDGARSWTTTIGPRQADAVHDDGIHTFNHHTLDGTETRTALLDLITQLGSLLRHRGQAARALTLTLRFAGGTAWEKTRRLPEPSAHDDDLRTMAYRLIDAAGLQRGRLIGLALKGEDLIDVGQVAHQISLDEAREARLVTETAVDRVRDKFGHQIIGPATVFRRAS
ncbi:DinB/UmuC family translesion DNA polymerase [Streptomyces flaveolus]|uniref:DinB/UmuC family translesion DNA polymerase n=1 Tax=Streptomyces flaveolus TaxID=67297 RepID=UPI0036F5E1F6